MNKIYICIVALAVLVFVLFLSAVLSVTKTADVTEQIATWAAAGFALGAAWLWYKASVASVPAPPETSGVGALFGGYLISKVDDKRIDLHATLDIQSRMNAKAALAATASAILTAISLAAKALHLP
ncbi:hypothetical protein [Methylobacterium brachiatum]|uniref:hypothetical protein n=1 Tax=Methylobacterium brachiatum TaxID=269660 RepID=UPI0013CE84AD|nr:hypothetical protein [Methylobacterium brachiatum]